MTADSFQSAVAECRSLKSRLPLCLSAVLLCLCITRDGFWIDEISTAWIAGHGTSTGALAALARCGSEAQMPGFVAWIWAWARLFGNGELSLRLANLPWLIAGLAAMSSLFRRNRVSQWAMLFALHPLLCFQMNEARPYIMTFGTAAVALDAVDALMHGKAGFQLRLRQVAGITALGICVSASMLNLLLIPALAAYSIAAARATNRDQAGSLRPCIPFAACAALIGTVAAACFLWTMSMGYGGRNAGFSPARMALAAYEFAGFRGLGPPWTALREQADFLSFREYLPSLAFGSAAWLAAAWCAFRLRARAQMPALVSFLAGLVSLAGAATFAYASLSGRHFIFLMPFFLLLLGMSLIPPDNFRRSAATQIAPLALIAAFLLSSLALRLSPDHGKDPFREVIAEIRENWPLRYGLAPVVWVAYGPAVYVYGGTLAGPDSSCGAGLDTAPPIVVEAAGWDDTLVNRWVAAHPGFFLVQHRPDVCDPSGAWQRMLSQRDAIPVWTLRGMRIYRVGIPAASGTANAH